MREVEVPEPGPGELVIQIEAALTCGTDLKTYRRGHPKFPFPVSLGHEFSGRVWASDAEGFRPGDPIMAVPSAPCLECRLCRRGLPNLCETIVETMAWGAFADKLLLPRRIVDQNVFPRPAHVSALRAAFLEPLACVVYGQALTPIREGDTEVVIGCGTIGLLHAWMAHRRGAGRVLITGRHQRRLSVALAFGAQFGLEVLDVERVNPLEAGQGDVIIECVGRPEVWQDATKMVTPGGFVLLFGGCPGGSTATFDTARLHYDQITLQGVFHFRPKDVAAARDILISTDLPVEALLSDTVGLDGVADVMGRLDRGEGLKYAVLPELRLN
jgi:L-iditol 2-dehydrogenase